MTRPFNLLVRYLRSPHTRAGRGDSQSGEGGDRQGVANLLVIRRDHNFPSSDYIHKNICIYLILALITFSDFFLLRARRWERGRIQVLLCIRQISLTMYTAQCSRCQLGCSGSQNFPCISVSCYRSILSETRV